MITFLSRQALALAALMAIAGCSADRAPPAPSPPANGMDAGVCASAGGVLRPVCRMQRPMCVIPYSDAGKVCTDDAQCAGGCVYAGAPIQADGATSGACRKDNDPCGCIEHVNGGRKVGGVCVD